VRDDDAMGQARRQREEGTLLRKLEGKIMKKEHKIMLLQHKVETLKTIKSWIEKM